MMSSRRFAFSVLFATAAIGLPAAEAVAQPVAVISETPRGWIGISFEVVEDAWGRASAIEVTEVVPGSPAAQAGVRPGDHILAINDLDEAHELAQLTSRLRLSPGDVAVAEVERGGRLSQLRMVATTVPANVVIGSQVEVEFAPERIQTWVQQMDSLRIIIQERQGSRNVRVLRDGSGGAGQGRLTVVQNGDVTTVRAAVAPFEFHLFQGEQYDSLNREMVELNQVMESLRIRLIQREAELLREDRSRGVLHLTEDNEFRRLSAMLRQASDRSATLTAAMAESARETAESNYFWRMPGEGSSVTPPLRAEPSPEPSPEFRPLTPYLVGRNRVAGAELVDVKPELASYFGVDGGVLIVDIVPGSPAARAGIRPGDVITRVDERTVRTVEALRLSIAAVRGDVPLAFVREGEARTTTLPRR